MELTSPPEKPESAGSPAPVRPARLSMLAILASALTGTASEVCLKIGAAETASHPVIVVPWLGLSGLESKWVWFGIIFTILSFLAWVQAIRAVPLSIAFTFSNVIHVFVPLSCWLILGEVISPRRWLGIALVIIGLVVIARPFARLDEKLEEAL